MKNGFIKKNNNKVYGFNSSKNIEHKGFKLYDYIETLKKNIINLFNINQKSLLGVRFGEYRIQANNTYEDISYTTEYNRNNGNSDFEVTNSGIYIKSLYKKNLVVNLCANVRADSGVAGLRYFKIELWRNGSVVDSTFTATEVGANGRANVVLPIFFKCTYNDIVKVKAYGRVNDTFLLTTLNMELSKNDNINYYNF